MALYEYELYLIREAARGEIMHDLHVLKQLEPGPGTSIRLPFGVHAEWSEATNRQDASMPVQILTLAFETAEFEDVLKLNPADFTNWLWTVAEQAGLPYAFMSSGSYAAYYESSNITPTTVFAQLGALLRSGALTIVHPVMFIAERLGDGKTCETARTAPGYYVDSRAGLGCLLMLIDGDPQIGPVEILDPGTAYPRIAAHFKQSTHRAAP